MFALLSGALLCLITWVLLRRSVGAGWQDTPAPAIVLDGLPVLIGFLLLLCATARPLLSAMPVVAMAAGLGLVDRVKRAVLREPVVFADRAELLEVVRHPRLYLPFAGTGTVLGGAAAAVLVIAALTWLEPPLWPATIPQRCAAVAGAVLACWACFVVPCWPPLLRHLARRYAGWGLTRDPAGDAARLGLLACIAVHATLARAERPARREAAWRQPCPSWGDSWGKLGGPVLLVQAESFLDARRLHPGLADALPNWGALQAGAMRHGRLAVPCWGANTVRSEFAVLTGLPEQVLGLDRFNPYEAFARAELPSVARQARQAGYRTVCVHPFDLGFYARDRVLPLLGFDELIGPEAFADARRSGAYVADVEVAAVVRDVVARHGPRVLVLAITMENHGPWDGYADPVTPAPLPAALAELPEREQLARWLHHLRGTDAMIPVLTGALAAQAQPGVLLFYGDHQPSLPHALRSLAAAGGEVGTATDYVVWRPATEPGQRQDAAAHDLPAILADCTKGTGAAALVPVAVPTPSPVTG